MSVKVITEQLIQEMFSAYNRATGFNVPFNVVWERQLWEAAKIGLTAEMFFMVVSERMRGIGKGERKPACVMPRNLVATDDAVNEVLCEAHAIAARKRIQVMEPARASVLSATGRSTEPVSAPARSARDVLEAGWEQVKSAIKSA